MGTGQFVQVKLSGSQVSYGVDTSWTEPRFLDRNLSLGVDAFVRNSDYKCRYRLHRRRLRGLQDRRQPPLRLRPSRQCVAEYQLHRSCTRISTTSIRPRRSPSTRLPVSSITSSVGYIAHLGYAQQSEEPRPAASTSRLRKISLVWAATSTMSALLPRSGATIL